MREQFSTVVACLCCKSAKDSQLAKNTLLNWFLCLQINSRAPYCPRQDRANPTLASAAQASSKWMEVNLGDSALCRLRVQRNLKLFTTLIRKHRNQPGTSFGIVPGLPISSYWRPVDRNWVSLHATFLQNKLPSSDLTFRSDVGIPCRASQRKSFLQVAELEAKRNINRPPASFDQHKLWGCLLVKRCRFSRLLAVSFVSPLAFRDSSRDFPQLPKPRNVSRENSRNDGRNSTVWCFKGQREKTDEKVDDAITCSVKN